MSSSTTQHARAASAAAGMARLLVAGAVLAACGGSGEPRPVDIVAGVDVCAHCGMAIDDPTRAAQWIEPDGRISKFDEPGDLVAWLHESGSARGTGFVGDAAGTGWVPVAEASFVRGALRTPMGHDIVAYRSRASADSVAAARGGTVLDWSTLREQGVGDAITH